MSISTLVTWSAMNLWCLYIHISFPFKTTVDMSNLTPTWGWTAKTAKSTIFWRELKVLCCTHLFSKAQSNQTGPSSEVGKKEWSNMQYKCITDSLINADSRKLKLLSVNIQCTFLSTIVRSSVPKFITHLSELCRCYCLGVLPRLWFFQLLTVIWDRENVEH